MFKSGAIQSFKNVNSVFTMTKVKDHVSVSCEDENINLLYVRDFDFMSINEAEGINSHRSTCVNNSYDTVSDSKNENRGVGCDEEGNMSGVHDVGDVDWTWEDNIFHPELHSFTSTSSIQPDLDITE